MARLTTANKSNIYRENLGKNNANYQPLTPIHFLKRAADVFPNHPAIIYGKQRYSYLEFWHRSQALASSLSQLGIGVGDTVSALLANTPIMLELHYAVPMCGAVLHPINTRLNASVIAYQLEHCESKLVFCDSAFSKLLNQAIESSEKLSGQFGKKLSERLKVVDYFDLEVEDSNLNQHLSGEYEYQSFLQMSKSAKSKTDGNIDFSVVYPVDEWEAISVNYTSGTTGKPKGAVYSHRGAYLLGQGNALTCNMAKHSVYLWTLPMFHCNGWCFPWTISAIAGTHICLREVRGKEIWQALKTHNVTHLCGAPVVMSTILAELENQKNLSNQISQSIAQSIDFFTAAAPPPESVLTQMKECGFNVVHLYGLTEVYGPAVINDWHGDWDNLDMNQQAKLKARQGVRYHSLEDLDVCEPSTLKPVVRDGQTIGEVMFRGNLVMKGYLKNKSETQKSFKGGWFHSGDLAVMHPDGYLELKDRSKDIIISGGENISSIEIENVLYKNPAIKDAAVVAISDEKWGESPCAFIELKSDAKLDKAEVLDWCAKYLARFKIPKQIIFEPIAKTSTGKVQKFILRQRAKELINGS